MKRLQQLGFAAGVTLLLASAAFAQAKPAPPTAVGLIDFQRAVEKNDDGVKAAGLFTAEGEKLREILVKSKAKVDELQEKLTKMGPTASDVEKSDVMRSIDRAKKDYDLDQQDAQQKIQIKNEELFRPVADRVRKVVEVYGKELNLAVVMDASDDLLFANDVVDITTEIIRRVNADIAKNPSK